MSGTDLISRQAAIEAVRKCSVKEVTPAFMLVDKAEVMTELMMLPPAQPERKKGEWIPTDDGWDGVYYECSCCKEAFTLIDGTPTDNLYYYCPNCGADMKGEQS